jgi:hypothetical protein
MPRVVRTRDQTPLDPGRSPPQAPCVRAARDDARITRRFEELFRKLHEDFLGSLEGFPLEADRESYASVMLGRLMFVSFLQERGLLDGDRAYLRNRLRLVRRRCGAGQFHSFYRRLLLRLFHDGPGRHARKRQAGLDALLGKIPCLGGGLSALHELEEDRPDLHLPDKAFARVFNFFGRYQWHLEDRPPSRDHEITPAVLGHVFEKHLNRKQLGAYYTGADITEYIARSTIVPFLLDAAAARCPAAFRPDGPVWRRLREAPDRYLFEALRHGVDRPLPAEVAAGLNDTHARTEWNRLAPAGFAVPNETWREHVTRRRRCEELRRQLAAGAVHTVNDLVSCNLDIRRFAVDVLDNCDDPELLHAFWAALQNVSVLDPTCGSGAFLFAALDVLEPLHDACLERMRACLDDAGASGAGGLPAPLADFRRVLDEFEPHPGRGYFVLKSILVRSLYGVDLRKEAVEICKLRLFLKLLGRVPCAGQLQPLPDLDCNIRAGNTLVGFARPDGVRGTLQGRPGDTRAGADLRRDLDRRLALEYGIDPDRQPRAYRGWLGKHQPFHWFAEFPGVMSRGGFDVILGNPPYVEYRLVRGAYRLPPGRFETERAENLYAPCMERSARLAGPAARFGMIVPAGLLGLDEVRPLRKVLLSRFGRHWFSTYAIRPAKLFEGVDQRLCIALAAAAPGAEPEILTTRYHHWSAPERPHLFTLLHYERSFVYPKLDRIPQIGCGQAGGVFAKLAAHQDCPLSHYLSAGRTGFLIHYHRSPRYWIRGMDFEPHFRSPTRSRSVHHFRDLHFRTEAEGKVAAAALNSSLFFLWFLAVGNGRNLTGTDVEGFPLGPLTPGFCRLVAPCFDRLMADYRAHSFIRTRRDCEFQEFRPGKSRPILNEIDGLFARHFGFTAEELDFVRNYEVKYRLGQDETEEDGVPLMASRGR